MSPDSAASAALAAFLRTHAPVFVLTGAGCSTDSGIPDYRDRDGRWKHAEPIRYQRFLHDPNARRRYWLGSWFGWPRIDAARPNAVHHALAALERRGTIGQLVTQNVDGLHQRAGARRVIDLHGRLDAVDCLGCGARLARPVLQQMLAELNPMLPTSRSHRAAPDGDTLDVDAAAAGLRVPDCPHCGGLLKPAVVFFGENVPRPRVDLAMNRLARTGGLLVVGSSLTVYSGYRFCVAAARFGLPIALLNRGVTRADDLAALKCDMDCRVGLEGALRLLCLESADRGGLPPGDRARSAR